MLYLHHTPPPATVKDNISQRVRKMLLNGWLLAARQVLMTRAPFVTVVQATIRVNTTIQGEGFG